MDEAEAARHAARDEAELRGDRVACGRTSPGAWRLGDADEVRAWLDAEAPASATA